jgi:hypothetical protein
MAIFRRRAEVLTSTEIYNWAHGRRRFGRRKSMPFGVYSRQDFNRWLIA